MNLPLLRHVTIARTAASKARGQEQSPRSFFNNC